VDRNLLKEFGVVKNMFDRNIKKRKKRNKNQLMIYKVKTKQKKYRVHFHAGKKCDMHRKEKRQKRKYT